MSQVSAKGAGFGKKGQGAGAKGMFGVGGDTWDDVDGNIVYASTKSKQNKGQAMSGPATMSA